MEQLFEESLTGQNGTCFTVSETGVITLDGTRDEDGLLSTHGAGPLGPDLRKRFCSPMRLKEL